MSAPALTLADAARMMRDAVKEGSHWACPLGQDVAAYLHAKRKRLTPQSYRTYENTLDVFVERFCDLDLRDFAPPVGTRRLEEFLDRWGGAAPATYNKHHAILKSFFKWAQLRELVHGDPTLAIERARSRDVHRETFNGDQIRAIIDGQDNLRDKLACRLMLDFGLRKGTLGAVQFKHFDHAQRRLTVFSKGGKVRRIPIPSRPFWHDLERLILDVQAEPNDYLMWRSKWTPRVGLRRMPGHPLGVHGLHAWWYRCLTTAGVVPEGTTSGERMHKARHTAGQRVLDATGGNLKAVQKLLGHASIATTGDIYADWDIDQLAQTLADVLGEDEE